METRIFYTNFSNYIEYEPSESVAYTDLLSNGVFLRNDDILGHLDEIRYKRLNLALLPNYLHECAHHGTFKTLVGSVLANLWASCQTHWVSELSVGRLDLAARDLLVFDYTRRVLTPLTEGLALFAEHDLVVGNGELLSHVTFNAQLMFTVGRLSELSDTSNERSFFKPSPSEFISRAHNLMLAEERSKPDWVDRKAFLLGQPIEGSNNYLLGYLTIKSIYINVFKMDTKGKLDPEELYLFLVSHFFKDSELVDALLNIPRFKESPEDSSAMIADDLSRIDGRLMSLFEDLKNEPVSAILKALVPLLKSSGAMPLQTHTKDPGTDLSIEQIFMQGARTVGMQNISWPKLLEYRMDFRFACQMILIDINDSGLVIVSDTVSKKQLLKVNSIGNIRPGKYTGTLEAIQLRNLTTTVICILTHYGLVAVLNCANGEWNSQELVDFLEGMPSCLAVEGAMHAHARYQSIVSEKSSFSDLANEVVRLAREFTLKQYVPLLSSLWSFEDQKKFLEATSKKGIAGFFKKYERFRRASLISSLVGFAANIDDVARLLDLQRAELLDEITEINKEVHQICLFSPFEFVDGVLLSRI